MMILSSLYDDDDDYGDNDDKKDEPQGRVLSLVDGHMPSMMV
jgi:hypothetical protein